MFYRSDVGVISRSLLPEETITWSVPNLINIRNPEEAVIISPWFSYDCGEWSLSFLIAESDGYNVKMGYFLSQKHPGKMKYNITLRMVLNPANEIPPTFQLFDQNISGQLDTFGSFGTFHTVPIKNFRRLMEYVSPSGRMNFICKIEKEKITEKILSEETRETGAEDKKLEELEENNTENENDVMSDLKGVDRLIENLKSLYLDGRHSDFVLKVDGREFQVHRGILGARSPVFAAMFKNDMVEKIENGVDIPDCVVPAFEIFLLYVYTGRTENLSEDNVFDVYYAADKYKVDDLKTECLEFIKSKLSVSMFCDVIALCLRHNEKELLKEATCFFKDNVKQIIKTVTWQKFMVKNPVEANELFIKTLCD